MECMRVRALIPMLMAGRLEEGRREEILGHLAGCLPCRKVYAMQKTIHASVFSVYEENKPAPSHLKESIRVCMDCMEDPGRRVCPRLRFKLRLVPGVAKE